MMRRLQNCLAVGTLPIVEMDTVVRSARSHPIAGFMNIWNTVFSHICEGVQLTPQHQRASSQTNAPKQ